MAVSVKLLLRKSKKSANGTAPVYLRITANRKSRYKSTGVKIHPKYWNAKKQRVRTSHELASALNDKLREVRVQAERAALKVRTAEAVKANLNGSRGTLTAFFKAFIESRKRQDQYWQRKKFNTTLNKLQAALGREEIDWNGLNRAALEQFERYCREERGNNPNTTRKELSRVRRVVRQALKEQVIDAASDPFLVYDLPRGVTPDRRRLTREEIRRMEEVDLSGDADGAALALARDAFLLSFYGGGIRFGDVCTLRPAYVHQGRLTYRMMKTKQPVDLPLPAPALAIVGRYKKRHVGDGAGNFLFPFLREGNEKDPVRLRRRIASCNSQVNASLKEVAKRAGVRHPDEVSMHVARHSFADFARRKSSDLYAVSKALGHSSLSITENYLSDFDRDATDRLAGELWD